MVKKAVLLVVVTPLSGCSARRTGRDGDDRARDHVLVIVKVTVSDGLARRSRKLRARRGWGAHFIVVEHEARSRTSSTSAVSRRRVLRPGQKAARQRVLRRSWPVPVQGRGDAGPQAEGLVRRLLVGAREPLLAVLCGSAAALAASIGRPRTQRARLAATAVADGLAARRTPTSPGTRSSPRSPITARTVAPPPPAWSFRVAARETGRSSASSPRRPSSTARPSSSRTGSRASSRSSDAPGQLRWARDLLGTERRAERRRGRRGPRLRSDGHDGLRAERRQRAEASGAAASPIATSSSSTSRRSSTAAAST